MKLTDVTSGVRFRFEGFETEYEFETFNPEDCTGKIKASDGVEYKYRMDYDIFSGGTIVEFNGIIQVLATKVLFTNRYFLSNLTKI